MSDVQRDRLNNLRRLVAERGLTPQSLSDRLGSRYSYWRDMLAGEKSFGEKAARRIEEGLNLPRGWLDGLNQTRALSHAEAAIEHANSTRTEVLCSVETCNNKLCRTDLICQRAWDESCRRDAMNGSTSDDAPVVAWAKKDEDDCWSCFWIQWDEDEEDPFLRFDPIPGATLLVRKEDHDSCVALLRKDIGDALRDIAALERDAARYRWIRESDAYVELHCDSPRNPDWRPEHLDAAIDAAMAEPKEEA